MGTWSKLDNPAANKKLGVKGAKQACRNDARLNLCLATGANMKWTEPSVIFLEMIALQRVAESGTQ